MAEQMTETLRRLPEELYRALGKQPPRQSTQKAKEDSDQSPLQASVEASLQASIQAQDPAAVSQTSQQSSGQQSQQTGQEQGERPRVQLPQDKPLGAAGPNRNKKPGPEDADFIIIQDRWRAGLPEDPRFRKGSIFDPYHQNVLKGDYPIIGNNIFLDLDFVSESFFNMRQVPVAQGVSANLPGSFEFFGRGRQEFFNQ